MSGNGGMRGFWQALTAHTDSKYQGTQSSATLIVTRLERDSSGGILAAYGTLQGEGDTEFSMPLRGASAAVGDHLLGTYPANNPAGGELTYVRHVFSSDPAAGLLVPDADLPAPAWDTVPLTTALDASTGGISSYVVAYFLAVEARYQPSGYTVSYRAAGGQWADQPVPHLGGAQQARLAINFPPGTSVDVRLRARYNWAQAESVASETRSITAAVDDVSPGNATNVIAETNTPGGLNIFAEGALDAAHFKEWQYEIATSSGGAGLVTRRGQSPYFFTGPSGDYYVAVRPVSKSVPEVLGGRYPGTGYAGPFTLNNPAQPLDTTPPPDWTSAPGIALTRVVTNNNGETAQLTVTLPTGYAYPSDYANTLVYVVSNGSQQAPTQYIPYGATSATLTVPFGTVSVTLRGIDKAGNISANPSPAGTGNLQPSGSPQAAPTLTVSTFALAIKLDWTAVPGALAYEVSRAPDVAGAPGTWATIATVDARMYLDTLSSETIVLPSYWYTVRAINALGSGPYSAGLKGTAGAVDASNLRLNSITANQIAANAIAANNIQAGAVTAGKLAADLVIASNIRTAASGARVEIHGQIPGDPNLNSILMVAASGVVRAKFSGDALSFLNDSGAAAITFGATSGIGYMQSTGGFLVRGDMTALDLTNSQYMQWSYTQPEGGAVAAVQATYLTRVRQAGQSYGIGFIGYRRDPSTIYNPQRIVFGYSLDPLNATTNLPTDRVEFSGGDIYNNGNHLLGGGLYLGGSGKRLYYNGGNFDMEGPVRSAPGDGSAAKMMHTGVGGNMHVDWSHGALYLGWFSNPTPNVIVGRGDGGNFGPIAASAFTVASSEQIKTNIADLGAIWSKLAALRPRKYRLTSDPPDAPLRFGFVAEEVAAIIPELVPTLPAAPYPGPVAPEYLPKPTPAIDIYALVTAVAAGLAEAVPQAQATIKQQGARIAALEATVADLATRLAALEAKGAA